jgi:hypothetical protein
MYALDTVITILAMQLIQIGEVKQKTVLELVQEMAARQFAEIEQLKRTSLASAAQSQRHRSRRYTNRNTR